MYRTKDQVALEAINEGRRRNITPKGQIICLAVELVESNCTVYANWNVPESLNLPHDAVGSDSYSVGPCQQQVVLGANGWWWADAATCMDPTLSAGLFYDRLVRTAYNSDQKTPGMYAADIQQPDPDFRGRYDERMVEAGALYDRLTAQLPEQEQPQLTEIVLNYDHTVSPQEYSWDCGPASAQVVLSGRGLVYSENDLINRIGTTVNGTDYVGLVQKALNAILPDANYVSVYLPGDPCSQEQKDALWANLTHSIDAGYGVVANIVAPPSNYPRGVKGSTSPRYGGGTIFHYVPVMGYDPDFRAVWVADPGFSPFGYWLSFDQLATLIPPKGYCYSTAAVPTPDPEPEVPEPVTDDFETWVKTATDRALLEYIAEQIGPGNPAWASRGSTLRDKVWSI